MRISDWSSDVCSSDLSGEGGSQLPDLEAEFNALPHVSGAVSAARTNEPNTANSQFFIMLAPRLSPQREYSLFSRVVSGMEHVVALQRGERPPHPSRTVSATRASDNHPPLRVSELMAAPARRAPGASDQHPK